MTTINKEEITSVKNLSSVHMVALVDIVAQSVSPLNELKNNSIITLVLREVCSSSDYSAISSLDAINEFVISEINTGFYDRLDVKEAIERLIIKLNYHINCYYADIGLLDADIWLNKKYGSFGNLMHQIKIKNPDLLKSILAI